MQKFRAIAAVAIVGVMGVMPAAAQGNAGTRGAGATTHGRAAAATTTPKNQGKSADPGTRGKSGDATQRQADAGQKSKDDKGTDAPKTAANETRRGGADSLAARISSNPEQLARINAMLPSGMTLDQATAGFKNQGQFIAALNASKNQSVSFADLQKAMTVDGLSLGQAVRKLKTPATTTGSGTTTSTSTTSAS